MLDLDQDLWVLVIFDTFARRFVLSVSEPFSAYRLVMRPWSTERAGWISFRSSFDPTCATYHEFQLALLRPETLPPTVGVLTSSSTHGGLPFLTTAFTLSRPTLDPFLRASGTDTLRTQIVDNQSRGPPANLTRWIVKWRLCPRVVRALGPATFTHSHLDKIRVCGTLISITKSGQSDEENL